MKLTLGFSPCPNDTFIFDALVNGGLNTGGLEFEYVLEDVETLNQWALEGRLDFTKLSFNALLQVSGNYQLLQSGAALGRGVGPLLITANPNLVPAYPDFQFTISDSLKIAIPGKNTTANLLLTLAFPEATDKTEVLFSEIENAVLRGEYDAGLVIHESRFTYAQRGLHKLMDMGEWWEGIAKAPIPLGCIAGKKSLGYPVLQQVESLIRQSVNASWARYPKLSPFITVHAQEMEEAVMRKHINLYVNDFTTDLGDEGNRAIDILFEKAKAFGMIRC